MKLYIANKNYSSWSMRPWVMLKQAGIEFEEVMVRFDGFDAQSKFKQTLKDINPVGKVPCWSMAIWLFGTPCPLQSTLPRNLQASNSGPARCLTVQGHAAFAPKCTVAFWAFAVHAP